MKKYSVIQLQSVKLFIPATSAIVKIWMIGDLDFDLFELSEISIKISFIGRL